MPEIIMNTGIPRSRWIDLYAFVLQMESLLDMSLNCLTNYTHAVSLAYNMYSLHNLGTIYSTRLPKACRFEVQMITYSRKLWEISPSLITAFSRLMKGHARHFQTLGAVPSYGRILAAAQETIRVIQLVPDYPVAAAPVPPMFDLPGYEALDQMSHGLVRLKALRDGDPASSDNGWSQTAPAVAALYMAEEKEMQNKDSDGMIRDWLRGMQMKQENGSDNGAGPSLWDIAAKEEEEVDSDGTPYISK